MILFPKEQNEKCSPYCENIQEKDAEIERLTTRINNAIIYMKTHRYAASTIIRKILEGVE